MYAMDFLLIKWSMDYAKVQNSESCNFLQIGDATFSIFVLQLSVFKLCNKHDESQLILFGLVELRNNLIKEGRYTDAVDDLILKLFG